MGASFVVFWPNASQQGGKPLYGINNPFQVTLGLDLQGGVRALLIPNETKQPSDENMNTARTLIEQRVNKGLGVNEPVVRTQKSLDGQQSIVVELPGYNTGNQQEEIETLLKTGKLEFWNTGPTPLQNDTMFDPEQFKQYNNNSTEPLFKGDDLNSPDLTVGQNPQTGQYVIQFAMKGSAVDRLSKFTANNRGSYMTITLDRKVISSAVIQDQLPGKGEISGNFTLQEAQQLVQMLKIGALPISFKIASMDTIGPTLGHDSIIKSIYAGAIGLAIIILFMLIYYRLPGLLADIALILYSLLTFAIFKMIGVTMSLAGIAGFVLSIGMAVDANVLIFERVKEELREGRLLAQAIDHGWSRAWPSIRDSNISTTITCAVLYIFGTTFGATIIVGFATTLFLGVVISMFTAIVVTRTFLNLLVPTGVINHPALFGLPFGTTGTTRTKETHTDENAHIFHLAKHRYWFLGVSLLVIIPGIISLFAWGLNVGIDFKGGSSVELVPQKTIANTEDVRDMLKPLNLHDLQVVFSTNEALQPSKKVWIQLNTQVSKNVTDYITNTLQKKYPKSQIQLGIDTYTDTNGKSFSVVAVNGLNPIPSTDELKQVLGTLPKSSEVTNNEASAQPTATAQATSTPSATATAQPTATSKPEEGTIPVNIVNITTGDPGQKGQTISLMTSTSFEGKGPVGSIQNEFLKHGIYTQLQSSSHIGASVAEQTRWYAVYAVAAASAMILLYIWFAFRKIPRPWRYGACAIIAMLHDVLIVIGIFSILGHFFGIQIDSLFITALLTVIGFSVHDTIVVFDRIRENMRISTTETFEQVVDASLVQTMARSLNTSLTVLFTMLSLTLFGGSGSVHTFTLCLLIGIFCGTYSSIFNASMLLVVWEKGELGLKWLRRKGNEEPSGKRSHVSDRELARSRG
jgi:preprotein translocase subunit SecD